MRSCWEPDTHVTQTLYFPFIQVNCQLRSGPPLRSTQASSAVSTIPCPAQVGSGRLPVRVYYRLQSGTLQRSVVGQAVLTIPGPLKTVPGGCLSESILTVL